MPEICVKRVYEQPSRTDGLRVLVDRLWPRGLSREKAKVDLWVRELAPSDELRGWYGHQPERFPEFRRRYRAELHKQRDALDELGARAQKQTVTLLFAARDPEHSNAAVLAELLRSR